MDIRDAARYFDQDSVHDAYTGAFLFNCHTAPPTIQTPSGNTMRRRLMVTTPDVVPPARRAVGISGEVWIMGNSNVDSFRGVVLRRNHDLKISTGLMTVLTPGQACLGVGGTDFHAHREFYREMQDVRTSADLDPFWNVFFGRGEPVAKGNFLRQDGMLYRVRVIYPTVDDFLTAEADQLDADALQTATFTGTAVDLVTDKPIVTSTAVATVQTDPQKCYQFRTQAESALQPGDRAVFVAKSAFTPAVGNTFTMQGAKWRVMQVVSEQDAWMLLARRA